MFQFHVMETMSCFSSVSWRLYHVSVPCHGVCIMFQFHVTVSEKNWQLHHWNSWGKSTGAGSTCRSHIAGELHAFWDIDKTMEGYVYRLCSEIFSSESNVFRFAFSLSQALEKKGKEDRLPPVQCYHGEDDDLVLYDWGKDTHSKLTSLGVKGDFTSLPSLAHSINETVAKSTRDWIAKVLPQENNLWWQFWPRAKDVEMQSSAAD